MATSRANMSKQIQTPPSKPSAVSQKRKEVAAKKRKKQPKE
tara:strand:+ start:180 stop:302 length:123 start_codon:yes stop_codon:yes gene_type:complete